MTLVTDAIQSCVDAVVEAAAELNLLDAHAGDGDLGATMTAGARALAEALPGFQELAAPEAVERCGMLLARSAPSTCGTLLATALLRCASDARAHGPSTYAALLEAAAHAIAERGKAEPGSKTMLDALLPAARAAASVDASEGTLLETLVAAAAAADQGARATAAMVPRFGRAGWLAERSLGHEDGGARLIAILLEAIASSVETRVSA